MAWSSETLCTDNDLVGFESNVLAWSKTRGSCDKWIAKAKYIIGQKLRFAFRSTQIDTDTDVLDLILDTSPLLDAACYLTLHLLCNDASTGDDVFKAKAEMYEYKFNAEWPLALGLISLDTDESGEIESTEMYNVPGITYTRGR